jgi:hypothetical protein
LVEDIILSAKHLPVLFVQYPIFYQSPLVILKILTHSTRIQPEFRCKIIRPLAMTKPGFDMSSRGLMACAISATASGLSLDRSDSMSPRDTSTGSRTHALLGQLKTRQLAKIARPMEQIGELSLPSQAQLSASPIS